MTTATEVLLFVPNIIGYFRVLFTLTSFVIMTTFEEHWEIAVLLYSASFAGDLFDGWAARKFNQSSTFGGLLDMVTDRCSTLGLLYILGCVQNTYRLVYLLLVVLDISSHWCQMYSSVGQHHKSKESNLGRNIIVQWYYQYYFFFGYLCVGAEFTYILAYILHYLNPKSVWFTVATFFFRVVLPGCLMKQIVNFVQLSSACYLVAAHDAEQYTKDPKKS